MANSMVVFHGTEAEGLFLIDAIAHNCTCAYDMTGQRTSSCPAHDALLHEQRFIDGLLVSRRRRDELNHQEHDRFDSCGIWVQG